VDQERPLDGEHSQQHVQGDRRQAVPLQEGHQESEANEDHDMDILEHWVYVGYHSVSLFLAIHACGLLPMVMVMAMVSTTIMPMCHELTSVGCMWIIPSEEAKEDDEDELESDHDWDVERGAPQAGAQPAHLEWLL